MANITGTEGDDQLFDSGSASDVVLGLGGNDTISGGSPYTGSRLGSSGPDTLDGGEGNDIISIIGVLTGNNLLIGGNGDDVLNSVSIGSNTLQGGEGNDTLESAGSNGILQGGNGNDVFIENGLFLGNSANTLEGGNGDDIFELISRNTIDGGDGFDAIGTYRFNNPDSTNPVNINVDNIPFSNPKITNVETAVNFTSGAGNDVLTLSRSITGKLRTVDAGDGNDLVTVLGDAHASINGGKGVDQLYGGAGVDILNGGEDDDFAYGGDGDDNIFGGLGLDNLEGNEGNDTIQGEDGDDGLAGQEGDDLLVGGNGNDRLYGWTGNDILNGDAGDDVLYGDGGNDTLRGGQGNDTLTGDLVGQPSGADIFAFDSLSVTSFAELGIDTITDFQSGTDKILLDKAIFTALPDTLNDTSFQVVANIDQAMTSAGLIVYSQGQLFYNANGTEAGYGNGGAFANFSNPVPTLSASDFLISGIANNQ